MPRPDRTPHLRALDGGATPEPSSEPGLERALVERAQGGDGPAWARLYQLHFDGLFRDLLFLVEEPAAAEELVQETFASALVSLRRFDRRSSFGTWLRAIGHNLVRNHWRSHTRRDRAYERLEQGTADAVGPDPEALHLRDQRVRVLSRLLETLPVSYREVFVLRDVQGLEVAEVAQRLGISAGNVRVRANRARNRLRSELFRLGWLEEAR
ncbi:MAG: RNA polymerase sigma factor [Myxococcales bacterium]|nr:RNA polymerase sigma factor [Myxococcales bacterium]